MSIPTDIVMIIAMSPLVLLASTVILTEGIELAASLWRVERRAVQRRAFPSTARASRFMCLATTNRRPMVIETLDALARLDYDNFEVIVLDNNTPDPETWMPVEAHCAALGPNAFRFYHFDEMQGLQGRRAQRGADADRSRRDLYRRDRQRLSGRAVLAAPGLAAISPSPEIALVQGPQDYRDAHQNIFKAMAYEEYRGFFQIGMVERNEHNAIIQHGTMTIVRKDALEEVGGWATWCITEDTELGLRLFEAGYERRLYSRRAWAAGLMPDTLKRS